MMTMMRRLIVAGSVAGLLVLGACSGGADTPEPEPSPVATVSATPEGDDVTTEILELGAGTGWDGVVTSARVTGETLRVETTLVDPRTDGSVEGRTAVEICLAGQEWMTGRGVADPGVNVYEADGTSFAVRSAMYAECAEV